MAAEEVAALEETVTEAMEAAVEVAAIEEAEAVAMATATEATVAAEAVEAMVEAVEVAAAMAETAMEVMVAAMIRDIEILDYNREKHCKTLQWLADQQLTIFVIPSFFFSTLICNYPVSVNSADIKLGTLHEVKRLLSKLLSPSRNQQKVLLHNPAKLPL